VAGKSGTTRRREATQNDTERASAPHSTGEGRDAGGTGAEN
jgi:hypothetical protein